MSEEPEDHFVGKVAQKAIIERTGKVLITRDSRDDVFELPGGRLNASEEPETGLAREVQEELGIAITVTGPSAVYQFFHKFDQQMAILIAYHATLPADAEPQALDPIEVAEMVWVDAATWQDYDYFPEYKQILADFFTKQT